MGRAALGLACVLACAQACGDDDGGMDAGTDAGTDAPMNDGGVDAGDDAGDDGGTDAATDAPIDAPTDGGPRPRQTRFTAILPTGESLSLPAQLDDGSPVLLTTSVAHDHAAPPGEDIFASRGSELFRATGFSETTITFGDELPLVDSTGASAEPSIFFSGELSAGTPTLVGVFGSNLRVYDFDAMEFGDPAALREDDGTEFTPTSATFVNPGGGTIVLFLKEGDTQLWFLDLSDFTVDPLLQPIQCSDSSSIAPDLILGAQLPGAGDPGLAEQLVVIAGSNAHIVESIAPTICFSDGFALVDGDGASLTPDQAFGWDFNDDGNDNLILVDTVEIPE